MTKTKKPNDTFRDIYKCYGKEIMIYINSYFPFDSDLAEDIFQNVFITVHKEISSIGSIKNIRAWLYKIAGNKSIDFKRKAIRTKTNPLDYLSDKDIYRYDSMEKALFKKEIMNIVDYELSKMPDLPREVFHLREYQHLPFDKITEITGSSISKVKKAMVKASLLLQKELEKRKIDPDIL